MTATRIPAEIIRAYRFVSTPNISDAMDRLGLQGHPRGIGRMWDACPKLIGTAVTMMLVPMTESQESPVIGTLKTIMSGQPGDILVIDFKNNPVVNTMGGVAGATAVQYGFAGCVADGLVRDIDEYKMLGLPVFARGPVQTSIRGRCAFGGHGIDVELDGVKVRPGDLLVGDENGLLVIPAEAAGEVVQLAQKLKGVEDGVIAAVRRGEDPIEAHERVSYDSMLKANA